jgi:hypothetical protein
MYRLACLDAHQQRVITLRLSQDLIFDSHSESASTQTQLPFNQSPKLLAIYSSFKALEQLDYHNLYDRFLPSD